MKSTEEILSEIDSTLDQLIENGNTLKKIAKKNQFDCEIQVLQKTQESLLARFMHLQELLYKNQKQIQLEQIEKRAVQFRKMNIQAIPHFSLGIKKLLRSNHPCIGRNRKKS